MMKYSNYFILLILLVIGFLFKDSIHISTNLLSLFASKEAVNKLSIADKLGYSKELLVVVKGLDKASKIKVREIAEKLKKVDDLVLVQLNTTPSSKIQKHYKDNYLVLADFNSEKQTTQDIKEKLKSLYDSQLNSVFYTAINKDDPLKLFNLQSQKNLELSRKGNLLTLGNYGYLIRVSTNVSTSQMGKAKVLYKKVHTILDDYENVASFAPFYYTVENSQKIQEDVQWILVLSTIVLLIIYYLLLKNIKLLSHTLIALFSSMLFAALSSTLLFSNFNALSLAFGMSITAVSIDYLLHYHFHNFYQSNEKIDRNVLYGYMTTIVAFGIFSFIPIPIISQISFFAVMSLSFAFLLFTFVFPKLSIDKYVENKEAQKKNKFISAYIVLGISILLLIYSMLNIRLDSNIKNLDYQNVKLNNVQKLFTTHNTSKLKPVIVQGSSKKEILENLHILHEKIPNSFSLASFILSESKCIEKKEKLKDYDFAKLNKLLNEESKAIGFRDGYFSNSYNFTNLVVDCEKFDFDIFKSYNLSLFKDNNTYYTMAFVKDLSIAQEFDFVLNISVKEIFSKLANQMYEDLLLYSSMVMFIILLLLFLSVKRKIIYALNYILFPISITLAILVSFTDINLMHLFSLIILLAIGIDYGIYMSNTSSPKNTMLAIKYSILSTFGAFGVLIFSSIVALHSIGVVISIGAIAIFTLIKVMK